MAESWAVTSQRQTTRITPGGRFEQVMEVHFRTAHGVDGYVDVPLSQYTADNVKEQIDGYVAAIGEVHNL